MQAAYAPVLGTRCIHS